MWPDFYELGTTGMGRKSPLPLGAGAYVLVETMGADPEADQERYETVIGDALEAGIVDNAIIAQSQREVGELWSVRDSPGEWQRAGHWPQLSFDVSAPTGEIGALKREFLHFSRSPAELALMRAIKNAMDPHGILNPGKIF